MSGPLIIILVLLSIVVVVLLTSRWKLNAFIALFIVSIFLAITTIPGKDIMKIIRDGFGSTMGTIGLLIILGAIVAVILDKTGAALSIAKFTMDKVGQKNATTALGITGFVTGIPIFCDSGFIILSGLARSMSARAKIALPVITIVLACALYSVHCLIPPHPGSLAAAGIMDVNIGKLMMIGILFAVPGLLAACAWISYLNRKKEYAPLEESSLNATEHKELPPVSLSLLPILVPIFLIALSSVLAQLQASQENWLFVALSFCGEPIIALSIGALLSLLLIRKKSVKTLNAIFEGAIEKAGTILVVTAAGGMFGYVIRETGIGAETGEVLSKTGMGIFIPFLIAFVMKTAQGSSTVAIITTAAIISPMVQTLGLDTEWGRIFTVLSMGAGSMMISHANDSYFWVVSKFGGIDANITLRVFSSATVIMGLTTFIFILLASLLVL